VPEPSNQRDIRLDFFRGVALIFIFIDHIPENILSYFTLQSVEFFDAAEVFIFISGFTAAIVYGQRLAAKGCLYAWAQIWRRAWQLYVAHVFLFVIFVAEVSYTVMAFKNPMYNEETRVADFLDEPHVSVIKALLLQFQPMFLDILPLYIVMMLLFPLILITISYRPVLVLIPSLAAYLAVQVFGISVPAYPEGHVWFFNPLAWQLLFVSGAVLGHMRLKGQEYPRLMSTLVPVAVAISLAAVVIRLSWTLNGVWDRMPGLFLAQLWPVNKNNLSPFRVVPFFAAVVLVAAWVGPRARFMLTAAARPLVVCGRQSLEVFCLGIVLSALGHFILAEFPHGIGIALAVNAVGIGLMLATAKMIDWYKAMDRLPLRPVQGAGATSDGAAPR
jgi:hypothetical protein